MSPQKNDTDSNEYMSDITFVSPCGGCSRDIEDVERLAAIRYDFMFLLGSGQKKTPGIFILHKDTLINVHVTVWYDMKCNGLSMYYTILSN